ncbi:MAG: GHMP kinase [Candidatus Woesearchaeota archaeon]
MIITKTPFRVSFAGGGTDLKDFYELEEGAVLSTSINKYMYIAIHRFFENKIVLKYSQTENVDSVDQIQHRLIKHCFLKTKTNDFLEVTSFADIPSSGSGLGSSSAFTVGLLKALYTKKKHNRSNHTIAHEACEIEIDELKEPIGKQDQYACSVGGINLIRFDKQGNVIIEPVVMSKKLRQELENNLLMFYTGITRKANTILAEQKRETTKEEKLDNLRRMRDLAYELRDALVREDLSSFGDILHKGWLLKKQMASGVSNDLIDQYYEKALQLGAKGGKILGAGGGGFLLLYCEPQHQDKLRTNLGLREMKFGFDPQGSRIIYMEDDENE